MYKQNTGETFLAVWFIKKIKDHHIIANTVIRLSNCHIIKHTSFITHKGANFKCMTMT